MTGLPLQMVGIVLVVSTMTTRSGIAGSRESPDPMAEPAQLVDLWTPEPGWQVVQDHPVDPDLIVIGAFGEPYRYPDGFQPPPSMTHGQSAANRRRFDTAEMPRLVLRCEDGATALTVVRPSRLPVRRPGRAVTRSTPRPASAMDRDVAGILVLAFSDEERIDIDLSREGYRANEPVYVPDPYDTIGRLRRAEKLYYFEIEAGRAISFSYVDRTWSTPPDAEFVLEGLDDLLLPRRDPCAWRAS